jgi:hypothetical protein
MTAPPLVRHFEAFLAARHPPKTFCPSEVARSLTAADIQALSDATSTAMTHWRDAMPLIREHAWTLRARGRCEILQRGVVLGAEQVGCLEEIRGPIRIRRVERTGEDESGV